MWYEALMIMVIAFSFKYGNYFYWFLSLRTTHLIISIGFFGKLQLASKCSKLFCQNNSSFIQFQFNYNSFNLYYCNCNYIQIATHFSSIKPTALSKWSSKQLLNSHDCIIQNSSHLPYQACCGQIHHIKFGDCPCSSNRFIWDAW